MKNLILIITAGILVACSAPNNSFIKTDFVNIIDHTIPEKANLNDSVKINVRAQADNGCWRNLLVYLDKESGLNYSIKAYGTYESRDVCPANLVFKDTVINFIPTEKGMYLFQVYETPLTYKQDTLMVN